MINYAFTLNTVLVYSYSKRQAIEKIQDGAIIKQSIFRYICFKKYIKSEE